MSPPVAIIAPINPMFIYQMMRNNRCKRNVDRQGYPQELTNVLHRACSRSLLLTPKGCVDYTDEDTNETFVLDLTNFEHPDVGDTVAPSQGNITEMFKAAGHDRDAKMKLLSYAIGRR